MSNIALLSKLGVYVVPQFLTAQECLRLRGLMDQGLESNALVYSQDTGIERRNDSLRKTAYAEMHDQIHQEICQRVLALKPRLETHFSSEYAELYEAPKYLIYRANDFFAPHRDGQDFRRVNFSIFLNDLQDERTYDGGDLVLYGLLKGQGFTGRGMTVDASKGLLVAYPSDILHEVTPIISGVRYAIVGRFLDKEADYKCEQGCKFQR